MLRISQEVAENAHLTQKDPPKSAFRQAVPQVLAVMVKNLLLIVCGMCTGFPTILIPRLSVHDPDEILYFNENQISWIGALTYTWVPVGCLFSGVATKPFGRKIAMQIMSIPLIICWLTYRFSNAHWHIYFAIALGGFSGGLFEAPLITYVTEITQPHLRGGLAATAVLSLLLGHLILYLLATSLHWRTIAIWSIIPTTIPFFLLFLIPESPHWLIMKHRPEEARKSLTWLRGWSSLDAIEPEFQELLRLRNLADAASNDPGTKGSKMQFLRKYTKKNFLWPLSLLSLLFFLSSFTGLGTLQTYAVVIFATLHVPIDEYYATVMLGTSVCLGCVVCTAVIRYLGKRRTAFTSMVVSGICFITVATYAYRKKIKYFSTDPITSSPEPNTYGWIPLLFLNLSAFISYSGLKVVPWILIGEVYPIETRVTGSGISTAISYSCGFLVNKIFLQMVANLTLPGVFWLYGGLSLVGFVILYFVLPETEGKTLQEIADHFSGAGKLDNKVRRRGKKGSRRDNENRAVESSNC